MSKAKAKSKATVPKPPADGNGTGTDSAPPIEVVTPVKDVKPYSHGDLLAKAQAMADKQFTGGPVGQAELAEFLKAGKLGKYPLESCTKEQLGGIINALDIARLLPTRTVVQAFDPSKPHETDAIGMKKLERKVQAPEVVDTRGGTKIVKMVTKTVSETVQQPVLNFEEVQEFMELVPEQCADVNRWHRHATQRDYFTCVVHVGLNTRRLLVTDETFAKMRAM